MMASKALDTAFLAGWLLREEKKPPVRLVISTGVFGGGRGIEEGLYARDRLKKEFSVVRHFVTRVFERFDLPLLLSVLLFKGDCVPS